MYEKCKKLVCLCMKSVKLITSWVVEFVVFRFVCEIIILLLYTVCFSSGNYIADSRTYCCFYIEVT